MINTAQEHGDPQGMISLTRVHKKASFLPDISYREHGLHMTIALLIPPDEEGLGLCSPPQDFAIGAFHCKSQGSGKSKKLTFQAPPAFQKALPGELLTLTGYNGKTWGGTGLAPEQHKVQMAPLDTFMKLHATNSVPALPEYAFALCSPGTWPFSSTMDINILPEACLAYDTSADSENVPDDPIITESDTNAGSGKKQCWHKGKSKGQSNSSASEVSPGRKNRKPRINEALAKQVAQDLHLSSDGSDSEILAEILEDTNKDTRPDGELQPLAGPAWIESGLDLPGVSAPTPSTPTPQPTEASGARENATTTPGEEGDAGNRPAPPTTPATKPAMPGNPHRARPQPTVMPTVSRADTTSPSPVPAGPTTPPGLAGQDIIPNPNATPPVPPSLAPARPDLSALVADRSMAKLAQSLAVTQARGNPNTGAFSGIMTGLRQACGIMMEGFWEACLGIEVVVQKTLQEATAHDRAFTAKATQDLDLWTSALQPLFDTDDVSEADMEAQRAHARETGQVVSDQILGRSQQATQSHLPDGGPVWAALLESFAQVEVQCAATWEKVTKWVPEILAQHMPEGQVGVFLAALYQLMCMQQRGITSMVVAQARVPVHLGVHSWAIQASMTRLFAQVIPGLGSLSGLSPTNTNTSIGTQMSQPAVPTEQVQYIAIPPEGSTMEHQP